MSKADGAIVAGYGASRTISRTLSVFTDGGETVPEVSRFFGIVIYMYSETGGRHHRPHFHARYQGDEAVYAIDDPRCLEGGLPQRQHRLVQAWAEIHRAELGWNWRQLLAGSAPAKVPPLR